MLWYYENNNATFSNYNDDSNNNKHIKDGMLNKYTFRLALKKIVLEKN